MHFEQIWNEDYDYYSKDIENEDVFENNSFVYNLLVSEERILTFEPTETQNRYYEPYFLWTFRNVILFLQGSAIQKYHQSPKTQI